MSARDPNNEGMEDPHLLCTQRVQRTCHRRTFSTDTHAAQTRMQHRHHMQHRRTCSTDTHAAVRQQEGCLPAAGRQSGVIGRWHTSCGHRAPGTHTPSQCPGRSGTGSRPGCCSQLLCSLRLRCAPACACAATPHFLLAHAFTHPLHA